MRFVSSALVVATAALACTSDKSRPPQETTNKATTLNAALVNLAPMDLTADSLDGNGLPLNPKWQIQMTTGNVPVSSQVCGGFRATGFLMMAPTFGSPRCVSDASPVSWDTGAGTCQLRNNVDISYHGHINWYTVAYTGAVRFEAASEASTGRLGDRDYNFGLIRSDHAGVTDANRGELHLEMDRAETFDLMRSPWWSRFAAVIKHDEAAAKEILKGHLGTAIGLFGLDGVHTYVAELHPVYALGILVQPDREPQESWELFVRNSSKNEGYCSRKSHNLEKPETDTIRLDIPWHPNAVAVEIDSAVFSGLGGASYVGIQMDDKRLAAVFVLPRSNQKTDKNAERSLIDGSLYVRWTMGSGAAGTVAQSTPTYAEYRDSDPADSLLNIALSRISSTSKASSDAAFKQMIDVDYAKSRNPNATAKRQVVQKGGSAVATVAWPTEMVVGAQALTQPEEPSSLFARQDSLVVRLFCKSRTLTNDERKICPPER